MGHCINIVQSFFLRKILDVVAEVVYCLILQPSASRWCRAGSDAIEALHVSTQMI